MDKISIANIMSGVSYDQPDTYLQLLSINNGSAIINICTSIGFSLIIPFFHIIFSILYLLLFKVESSNKFKRIISRIIGWICFGWYIRYIMEAYLLMIISSLTEINRNNTHNKSRTLSYSFSIFIFICCIFCIICSVVLNFIARPSMERSKITSRWCHQCFSDSKDSYFPRCMSTLFFLRRILLCFIVIVLKSVRFEYKLAIFVSIQLLYLILFLAIRPFNKIKNLVLEILNEFIYLVLCCLLFKLNKENDWTSSMTQVYIWIIISNNIIFVIISISGVLYKCISKLVKSKVQQKNSLQTKDDGSKNQNKRFDQILNAGERHLNEESKHSEIAPSCNISAVSFDKFEANMLGKHYLRNPYKREIPFREFQNVFNRHDILKSNQPE